MQQNPQHHPQPPYIPAKPTSPSPLLPVPFAGLAQIAVPSGATVPIRLLNVTAPSDYPLACGSALDCRYRRRAITAQLTVTVTGTPLNVAVGMLNTISLQPISVGYSNFAGSFFLSLLPGATSSFTHVQVFSQPAMAPGSTYTVSVQIDRNGWRDLRVQLLLEYNALYLG